MGAQSQSAWPRWAMILGTLTFAAIIMLAVCERFCSENLLGDANPSILSRLQEPFPPLPSDRGSYPTDLASIRAGRELFVHEWTPNDPRAFTGDGLGPMFNERSCVACHQQGGVGGAGPKANNVQMVSVFSENLFQMTFETHDFSIFPQTSDTASDEPSPSPPADDPRTKFLSQQREKLSQLHPGFKTSTSAVLHRFSTRPEYAALRKKFAVGLPDPPTTSTEEPIRIEQISFCPPITEVLTIFEVLTDENDPKSAVGVTFTERNTPALFGAGLLDQIPDDVLEAAAARKFSGDFSEIHGRVSRPRGETRIGRFGWKAQQSSLNGFVRAACAAELGLDVPGAPQAPCATEPNYRFPGVDLSEDDCDAMVAYVASLPAPRALPVSEVTNNPYVVEAGRVLFEQVGCAHCHAPTLGTVHDIYSDLLLHDMGEGLGDQSQSYGGMMPGPTPSQGPNDPHREPLASEWRTPPLWGVADSAPYLHDGRAPTLELAILLHGGEARASMTLFSRLTGDQQASVVAFLTTLKAPREAEAPAARIAAAR